MQRSKLLCFWSLVRPSDKAHVTQQYYSQMPSLEQLVLKGQDPLEQYKFIVYSASPRLDSQKCQSTISFLGGSRAHFLFSLPRSFSLSHLLSSMSLFCFLSCSCKCNGLALDPIIVHRLLSIVYSDVFSDALMLRAIQGLKEEWMKWECLLFFVLCLIP